MYKRQLRDVVASTLQSGRDLIAGGNTNPFFTLFQNFTVSAYDSTSGSFTLFVPDGVTATVANGRLDDDETITINGNTFQGPIGRGLFGDRVSQMAVTETGVASSVTVAGTTSPLAKHTQHLSLIHI